MKKSYKKFILGIASLAYSSFASAQLYMIDPSVDGSFEWTTLATGGWSTTTSSSCAWIVGSAATSGYVGTKCAYVSNNGSSFAYNSSIVTHLYKDVTVPAVAASATPIVLSFSWTGVGEGDPLCTFGYDYMRVWLVPTSFNPAAGTQITAAGTAPTGSIRIDDGCATYGLFQNSSWSSKSYTIPPAYAGNSVRLVFEFRSDPSVINTPVAIDAVSFKLSCLPPAAPTNITPASALNICGSGGSVLLGAAQSGTASVSWYLTPTGGQAIGTGLTYQTPYVANDTTYFYAETFSVCTSASRTPFEIIVNQIPMVSILSSTDQVCSGGSVLMTAQGTASNYTWTANGSTSSVFIGYPSATGIYTLMGASAAGCTNMAIQMIKVNATPELYAISASNGGYICRDDNGINLTASGASANTYTWTGGDGLFFVGQSAFVSPKETTTYTVYGANQYGCVGSTTILQLVDICSGVKEVKGNLENLSVYPNPNNGEFTLELSNGISKTVEVIDVTGRMILSKNSDNDVINVNIKEFVAGVYYVKVKSGDASKVLKIVKQ